MTRYPFSMALLLAFSLVTGCSRGASDAPPPPVTPTPSSADTAGMGSNTWFEVRPRTLREEVPAVGSFRARQTTRVGAEVSGHVQGVLVDVGSVVEAGQTLVQLDRSFFEIEVAQRRAEVESAKARLASAGQAVETAEAEIEHARTALGEADLLLERMRALWEKPEGQAPSIPKSRFDEAVFGQREAAARVRSTESKAAEARTRRTEASVGVSQATEGLRYAEQRLEKTVVRAPYAGVVTARLVDVGEPVTATPVTHLVEVQETSVLHLEFSLPQEALPTVRKGTRVRYQVEGVSEEGPGEGEVERVFPTLDEATRSFRCRVVVDNAAGKLQPGLLARVFVTTRTLDEALVIPRMALGRDEKGWSVRVDGGGGRSAQRSVQLGVQTEDEAQVVSGLEAGDRVLVP